MFSWNYQDQVEDILWGTNEDIEDHIVPVPKEHERNSFSKYEKCSKKQKKEENNTTECSKIGTFESENNLFSRTMENNSDINKNQDLNDAGMDMDASWPELSNLSMTFCGNYNDRIDRDPFQTGLESKLPGASVLKSIGVGMAGYNQPSGLLLDKGSYLSKSYIHLIGNGMQLDAGPEFCGYGDEGNDGFMDYDWSNIEDLDDLDMLLRNNEMIEQANAFLASSTDVMSSTSQYITVPEFASCRDHQLDKGSAHRLTEHSSLNHSQKEKMADSILQTEEEQTTSYTCLSSESCGKHSPTSCKMSF
ncbi:hypothetical protein HPP92_011758 [Vanilla planifolia]|uniref:Uncharacterized protein n=1 Tax=Vanilla planifolia TaxID=51239 RepID=A0A835R7K5_VANPL|nr:hypothetical protein HPP92_011758 [Vanilla planifolia]